MRWFLFVATLRPFIVILRSFKEAMLTLEAECCRLAFMARAGISQVEAPSMLRAHCAMSSSDLRMRHEKSGTALGCVGVL